MKFLFLWSLNSPPERKKLNKQGVLSSYICFLWGGGAGELISFNLKYHFCSFPVYSLCGINLKVTFIENLHWAIINFLLKKKDILHIKVLKCTVIFLKGLFAYFQVTLHSTSDMADLQRYPLNFPVSKDYMKISFVF